MAISSFNNFIGQDNIIERILILIKGSKIQNIALSHILLIGSPGIGKTTIASLIAQELEWQHFLGLFFGRHLCLVFDGG